MKTVAVLYAMPGSVYHAVPGVDVWDKVRDARYYVGPYPVVAHPPCAQWSRLRAFAGDDEAEKNCAHFALAQVRRFGGVLEHPAGSAFWPAVGLPAPGCYDSAGWTLAVSQKWFGHECEKLTLLYVSGVLPADVPDIPFDLAEAERTVSQQHSGDRSKTPRLFADWLVQLARSVR